MFTKITNMNVKSIEALLQQQAQLGVILGVNDIQNNRFMRDYSTGKMIGVQKMNTDNHGWDGVFKNGRYYENKNVKVTAKAKTSFAVTFQDTSTDKLNELAEEGVITTQSFWGNDGKRAFTLVGNTRDIGDYLKESYNPDSRKTSMVSMTKCINRGFKLVAGTCSKQQVIDIISDKFPRLGKTLTTADIYTEKEAKELVASMM